jgi:precorrin-3B C17-methyltransferase
MYLLECADGSYYTGSTINLELRLQQHQDGEGANHTKKHLPVKLVYFEEFDRIDTAFNREKQVQGWSRAKKEALINHEFNKLPELSRNYTQYPASASSATGETNTASTGSAAEDTQKDSASTSSATGQTQTNSASAGSATGQTNTISTGSAIDNSILPIAKPISSITIPFSSVAELAEGNSFSSNTVAELVEANSVVDSMADSLYGSVAEPVEARLSVVGIGPGGQEYILPFAQSVLADADVVIGYHYYFQFIEHLLKENCECIGKELTEEEARAVLAVNRCEKGKHVVVISSGDAGIYAMASLVYQYASTQTDKDIDLQTIPGISAFIASAGKLGAPLGHDFCCISLSDLMTPWTTIEKRIHAAATGDFVTSLYNPRSKKRFWQLNRLKEIFLKHRSPTTPVAVIRQVTRPEEHITITTLGEFDTEIVDMFSLVMIGNSQTYQFKNFLVTPRGYLARKPHTGQEIQDESFRQIAESLQRTDLLTADKWAVMRCVHTTADFEYENLYLSSNNAIEKWNDYLINGGTIITDVTMVQSGITKEFTSKYQNQVLCYLNDPQATALAQSENITRSQAGIRLALTKHPNALYVVGNAPTALFELCEQILDEKCKPVGVVGAPVGFVNVVESKLKLQAITSIPYVIIRERKGGSNVAASIVNAAFTLKKEYETI